MLKIKDLPREERPRERLIKNGSRALSNSELLAIILGNGTAKEDVLVLSKRLVKNHLRFLDNLKINELKKTFGIGGSKACQIIASLELGKRLLSCTEKPMPVIKQAKDIAKILVPEMSHLKSEHFKCVYLNSRNALMKEETIFIGTLNSNIVHPREIFKTAFLESAAAIILVHNHPSGDPEPSDDDVKVTKQLIKTGHIVGIEVLDHVIVGRNKYISLIEGGYI